MKKCFILLLMAMLCQNGFSQFFVCGDYSNDSCDGCTDPFLKSNDTTTQYFPYGGVFTPKGDIRAVSEEYSTQCLLVIIGLQILIFPTGQ